MSSYDRYIESMRAEGLLDEAQQEHGVTWQAYRQVSAERDEALEQRDRALAERDHARSLACSFEEKLALIRRRGAVRDHHV